MKTARDRAIEIAYECQKAVYGEAMSASTFAAIVGMDNEMGGDHRKIVDAIERGIEADRKEQRSMCAPPS